MAGADGLSRPASPKRVTRARAVARELAAVWRETKNTGRIPHSANQFQLTAQLRERLALLAQHPQDTPQRNGLLGHFRFPVSRADPTVVVLHKGGYDLACQPVRATRHDTWQTCFLIRSYPAEPVAVFNQSIGGGPVTVRR